ncbi:MAG: redoxin domain-containing protein [Oscillospiraceae bacterium]|nr:redoxin domain-containing protein [Oscillospiraceae bacterium]
MEKTYKLLKILLAVLCVIAVAAAIWRFAGNTVEEPAVTEAATQTTQETAAQTANPEMPDFTVYDLEGNAHRLSDYRGKPVILNFWASWCGPCKAEMPDFEEAYQTYGEDIHFLMVNLTDGRAETPEVVAAFIAEQGYTFPVFCDSDMDASAVYGINAIPVSYFIDAEGFLVAGQQGMLSSDALQRGIDLLLAN